MVLIPSQPLAVNLNAVLENPERFQLGFRRNRRLVARRAARRHFFPLQWQLRPGARVHAARGAVKCVIFVPCGDKLMILYPCNQDWHRRRWDTRGYM